VGFYATGSSMIPTILDGALLLVDTSRKELTESAIYVIRINEYLFAKRIHLHHSGKIDIISDNSAYPTETLNSEDKEIYVVGRVVGVLQPPS
jgi:phage repressor protein C with HTH and peptisase S24 domain